MTPILTGRKNAATLMATPSNKLSSVQMAPELLNLKSFSRVASGSVGKLVRSFKAWSGRKIILRVFLVQTLPMSSDVTSGIFVDCKKLFSFDLKNHIKSY